MNAWSDPFPAARRAFGERARGCSSARRRCGAPIRARRSASDCSARSPRRRSQQLRCTPRVRRPQPRLRRAAADGRSAARARPGAEAQCRDPGRRGPNPAAAPFLFKGSAAARAQALNCLASAVYYEAGNQDVDGERAVAQVVLNRVRHPAFPASVCGVVYQGSTGRQAASSPSPATDRSTAQPDADGWRRAMRGRRGSACGSVYAPVGWATHYHADYVVPYWASTMAKNAVVGAHLFYRWAGGWGQPAAFSQAYRAMSRMPRASHGRARRSRTSRRSTARASSRRRSRTFRAPKR